MPEQSLQNAPLDDVIRGCRIESGQPRGQEKGYCFELFRRAVEAQEQEAWSALDEQYRNLVIRWLSDGSSALTHDQVEEIAPETWSKFWRAQTNADTPLSKRFAHVGAVLKYLKQCTFSVVREYERRLWRRERIQQRLEVDGQVTTTFSEEDLLSRIDQERLLQQVRRWVETYVTDPQELQVLSLSYEQGLSPAEIARQYPQEFPNAQTVRRLKERVLKRARRAMESRQDQVRHVNGKNGRNNGKVVLTGRSAIREQGQKEVTNG
jgi:hypothetical protein